MSLKVSKHVKRALSVPYPPPYTPHWDGSTFPVFTLPPTISSYLYPLRLQYTILPVNPRIINPAFCIHYTPFPDGQDVLSLPLHVRYWTMRQRLEERGRRAEQIAASSLGGGGGLWWNVNSFMKNTKKVVRSKFARRMRVAFRDALSEAGFDDEGLQIRGGQLSHQAMRNRGQGIGNLTGNLVGSLRLNTTEQGLEASPSDLLSISRQVVAHLQEIRWHHQRGTVTNTPHRKNIRREQNWQEAKAHFMRSMDNMQAEIERTDPRRDEWSVPSDQASEVDLVASDHEVATRLSKST